MAIKWIKTAQRGLRYYEHPTRRHGKRRDRYYSVRFKVGGRDYTYGIGWWSDGVPEEVLHENPGMGFEEYCLTQLRGYKVNVKIGSGPKSPKERRQLSAEKEAKKHSEQEQRDRESITFGEFFEKLYFPWAKTNKAKNTSRMEQILYKKWLKEQVGSTPLASIAPAPHLQKVKASMAGKANKTIHHVLSLIRQVYNFAKTQEGGRVFTGENPVTQFKLPKIDNAKLRWLPPGDVERLLAALKEKSMMVHDQALLSAHCGLRFSEVAGLYAEDVDFATGTLSIRDGKTGSRVVFLETDEVQNMLRRRVGEARGGSGLLFPDERGQRQARVSKTFQRVADNILNQDIVDRRHRATFHTLRHSFGSLLYQSTGDLYLTQKALGHKTIVMAQRYSKLSEGQLRGAFRLIGRTLKDEPKKADNLITLHEER